MIAAMQEGRIGLIDQPNQGKKRQVREARDGGAVWCADNGAFSDKFDEGKWWKYLLDNAHAADSCVFAVAPDVVGNAKATLDRSLPWLPRIKALGYPVAYVAQNGFADTDVPWDQIDVLFIGGDDPFKLGAEGLAAVREAQARGKKIHMGRVNSRRRFAYALSIGCDSVDGTYLTYGPDLNLPDVLAWSRLNDQSTIFDIEFDS